MKRAMFMALLLLLATPAGAQMRPQHGGTGNSLAGTDNTLLVGQASSGGFVEELPSGTCTGSTNFLRLDTAAADGSRLSCSAEAGLIGGSTGATDNRVLRADGTGGATVQNSGVTIDDSANMSGVALLTTTSNIELGHASDTTIARTAAGAATLEGKQIKKAGKETIYIPAGAMKANVTSPASCGDSYDSGTNDLTAVVCAFDTGATEERADFQVFMPKNWDESTLTYQAIWTNTAGLTTETVQWELGCVGISDADTLNTTMGTPIAVSDTWLAQNALHTAAESAAVTCGGTPAEGDLVAFRISRDTGHANDNMTGDVLLIGLKIFWTSNAANDD